MAAPDMQAEASAGQGTLPFHLPRDLRRPLWLALAVLIPIWLTLIVVFKSEVSSDNDELGYHTVSAIIAQEMSGGRFFSFIGHTEFIKYPGYYTIVGCIYYIFGPYHEIARVFNCFALVACAVVVSNVVRMLAGPRASRAALLITLFCPLFTLYAIQLLRDEWVLIGTAVVIHHMLATAVARKPRVGVHNLVALALAYAVIASMRMPQAALMAVVHATAVVLTVTLGHRRHRLLGFAATAVALVVVVGPLAAWAQDTADRGVFASGEIPRDIDVGGRRLVDIRSMSDFGGTIVRHPVDLVLEYGKKVTHFLLGPLPLSEQSSDEKAPSSVFAEDFDSKTYQGYERIDVILNETIFWPFMTFFAPFASYGTVELWRRRPWVLGVIAGFWLLYALVIIIAKNDERWGMPLYLLIMVLQAYGWDMARGERRGFLLSFAAGFGLIVVARLAGIKLPYILLPFGWTALRYLAPRLAPVFRLRSASSRAAVGPARRAGTQPVPGPSGVAVRQIPS